jgi:hypothetical protein
MPDFSAACPDGSRLWRDDLRGRIAHFVIAGRSSAARLAQLAAHDRDVVTIVIPIDDVATAAACRTDDAALAKVLATLHAGTPARSEGIEALVDASGTLRALWAPEGKPDWRDDEVLQREIAAIRNNPVASRTIGSHLHGH